jgi:hypothetical protein
MADEDKRLRSVYKLSREEREAMYVRQDGKCAICGTDGRLSVDHNHTTGKVRALLCARCNFYVGIIEGQYYQQILAYIQKHEETSGT